MSVNSLQITGLRGFAQTEQLELAVPNGKVGSGITALVGPNNSGKSTIIEAFAALTKDSPTFPDIARNQHAQERVRIETTNHLGETKILRTVDNGGAGTTWEHREVLPHPSDIFVLPSRRTFNPFFGKGEMSRDQYVMNVGLPVFRGASNDQFYFRIFEMEKNKAHINVLLSRVMNNVPDWYIDLSANNQYYMKFRYGASYHNSDGLGEGVVSLLFIVDAIYGASNGSMIVIDEPELSLHPSLQKRLFTLLAEEAKRLQIVYATHSPYFIEWNAILSGAKIVRVNRESDRIVLYTPKEKTITALRKIITKNRKNPHVLGLDAREVFFSEDGIVLVEGQEDVLCYKEMAEQLDCKVLGTFFGWGVGGAGNMKPIATFLSELGFRRVVGILDNNMRLLKGKLEKALTDYQFFVIPADDVRPKPDKSIEGLLDDDWVLRDKYREDMRNLFLNVNEALSRPASVNKRTGLTPSDG